MHLISKTLSALLSCAVIFSSLAYCNHYSVNDAGIDYPQINASAAELDDMGSSETENDINPIESSEQPFDVFGIYDAYKSATTTTTTTTTTTSTTTTTTTTTTRIFNGIDVSMWQADVDWSKVKASGIDFAIIRAGYGKEYDQEDPYFDKNIVNAQKNGIDCGVYWYSYADTVADAYKEAEVCYSIIKEYNYEYPVYFDIEESKHASMTTAEVSAITEAFCSTLKNKGYSVGIYSYANFLSTKIYASVLQKYEVWVAHVGVSAPAYSGKYGIWQYSFTGKVNGINGDVDLNYGYVNYADISTPVQTTTTTTTTTYSSTTTSVVSETTVKNGINVSMWQGDVNWSKVKESGTEFAIIRAGYGKEYSQEDPYFDTNMVNAQAAGIDCGAYWYSYATTVESAVLEAEVCYSVIKGYTFDYPIIFAIEDSSQASLSKAQISAIIDAFCSTLEAKGYYTAVQTSTSFLNSKINSDILDKYDVCVEQFNVAAPNYSGAYAMWHYSCTGQVQGINGDVNLIYSYCDYPAIISKQ